MKKRFVTALILGGFMISTTSVVAYAANAYFNRGQEQAPNYSVNEFGQTYGSAVYAVSPETEPDLIAAVGTGGTEGYVYSKDLQEDMPSTPEEAVAGTRALRKLQAAAKSNEPVIVKKIPLYDIDGKTIIGEFEITNQPYEPKEAAQANPDK